MESKTKENRLRIEAHDLFINKSRCSPERDVLLKECMLCGAEKNSRQVEVILINTSEFFCYLLYISLSLVTRNVKNKMSLSKNRANSTGKR